MTHCTSFQIGQTVRNLGLLAKVDGFHSSGCLILRPFYADGTHWLANAERCEPVEDRQEACCHNTGLATFA